MIGLVFCCIFLSEVFGSEDGSSLPDASPPYDVTRHANWNLIDHENCGVSLSDRIIGGKNASLGQYPWLARIGYRSKEDPLSEVSFRCGGSLISPFYVVTAAHCVSDLGSDFVSTIRLGEFNADTEIDCNPISHVCAPPVQDFSPERIMIHRLYGKPKFKNDIALIRLNNEADLNGWVLPICLPHEELFLRDYTGKMAEVAGWGIYDIVDQKTSPFLLTIKMPIVALDRCVVAFRRQVTIDAKQICVGGKVGEDSCGGDSGGPLMKVDVLDGPPKYYMIGLVSFGSKNCGSSDNPAVYTRISGYIDWILDNMRE